MMRLCDLTKFYPRVFNPRTARGVKTAPEVQLMRVASDVGVAAHKWVDSHVDGTLAAFRGQRPSSCFTFRLHSYSYLRPFF